VTEFEQAVIEVLRTLAPGDVVTYGEMATEAGYPGAARAVGRLLATKSSVEDLPWWRVVAASGRLIPHDPVRHARLLKAEGVEVRDNRVVRRQS